MRFPEKKDISLTSVRNKSTLITSVKCETMFRYSKRFQSRAENVIYLVMNLGS